MDDLEFRRRCVADPNDPDEGFRRKLDEAGDNRRLQARQQEFDRQLREVLEDVPLPDGLAARIQLRVATGRHQARRRVQVSLALAASLVLAIGVAFYRPPAEIPLEQAVVDHIYQELPHLTEHRDIDPGKLRQLLASHGERLTGDLGEVRYAGACPIHKHEGVHIVLAGRRGPVTVLLMPGEHVAERTAVGDGRFEGVIIPSPGGSTAIIGEHGEPLEQIERRLSTALREIS